ncbi:MAG: cytochrome c5 family protein, partial [Hydrogenophilales bacterium 16-62-9]
MKMTSLVLAVSLTALLAACGKQETAAPEASAPAAPEATAPAATPAVEPAQGKSVFNKTCAMCHAVGAAGAPKPGDLAD